MESVLDEYTHKISVKKQVIMEERIRLLLRPRPKWMPNFIYLWCVKHFIDVQIHKTN